MVKARTRKQRFGGNDPLKEEPEEFVGGNDHEEQEPLVGGYDSEEEEEEFVGGKKKRGMKKGKSAKRGKAAAKKGKTAKRGKRGMNEFFKLLLKAKKTGAAFFKYKGKTYKKKVGTKKNKKLVIYKKA